MPNLRHKNILLGITGGIAAYKSILILRALKSSGAEVQVILTPEANAFVTPLTLSALSGRPVLTEMFDEKTGTWNNHVALAEWADIMLIAPLTINTMAKMTHGMCDNLLLCCYFSARCKVVVAPAMDLEMQNHMTVQQNMNELSQHGVIVIPPVEGFLASGLSGKGRMEEPENIVAQLNSLLASENKDYEGKRILVNAGPTREYLDPVRYISNESSGKMGLAIASELVHRGAIVDLVLGPVNMILPVQDGLNIHDVISAAEMATACEKLFPECQAAVLSAAVADFTPARIQQQKLKKDPDTDEMELQLKKTVDILHMLGQKKKEGQILVGFALETENEIQNAREKLLRKKADLMILNSLKDSGAGFGHDTNKITLIEKMTEEAYPLQTKKELAVVIADKLITLLS